MALFFGEWEFPSQENTIETCKVFAEYIDNGAKGDDFEGFKILYRLHDLHNGTGIFIAETTMQQKFLIMGQPSQRWENAM